MESMAGQKPALTWVTRLSVVLLVVLWLIPTIGLFVSSFRDRDQITASSWWTSMFPVETAYRVKPDATPVQDGDLWVIEGNVFDSPDYEGEKTDIIAFGGTSRAPTVSQPGELLELSKGRSLVIGGDGAFRYTSPKEIKRPPSLYFAAKAAPEFTLGNYHQILTSDGMDRAFINTLTVTIPSTIIPILIAAFAAYALAWMDFPGRGWLIAIVVGLLVVPLQLALVPMLQFHQRIGIGQSFYGIWFAHTAFGMPLAIYLLRNYMVGLPRDIIESAKVDGATDFQVFTKIVLPLSFPALASFAIFQFLWVWNDLLVAKVFLPSNSESWVMTVKIADDLLGSRGGDWGILAGAAFVSISVPLLVFFTMQRYLVRGLLAGSVK